MYQFVPFDLPIGPLGPVATQPDSRAMPRRATSLSIRRYLFSVRA